MTLNKNKSLTFFSPDFLLGIILILIIVLIIIFIAPDNPKDYLILISAITLIIGVIFTQTVKLYSEMRDRSFTLLLSFREKENYRDASKVFSKFIKNKDIIPTSELIDLFKSTDDPEKEKIVNSILLFANLFEEIAIAIKYDQVNEDLLMEFYNGIFIRFYGSTRNLYPLIRNPDPKTNSVFGKDERPEAFCNLDFLYQRWKPKYIKLINKL